MVLSLDSIHKHCLAKISRFSSRRRAFFSNEGCFGRFELGNNMVKLFGLVSEFLAAGGQSFATGDRVPDFLKDHAEGFAGLAAERL
jgi:hypothetical protein